MSCDLNIDPMLSEKFENVIKLIEDMTKYMPNSRPDCLTILSKTNDWCLQSKKTILNNEKDFGRFGNLYRFYRANLINSIDIK